MGKYWYNPEGKDKDEPTKGDIYGYIKGGEFYGATEKVTKSYICQYNIQKQCNIAEKEAAQAAKEKAKAEAAKEKEKNKS